MKQSAFTILTPIRAGEVEDLEGLLDGIGDKVADNPHIRFGELDDLHYASLFVVALGAREPYLVFEGNVDGRPEAFFGRLVEAAGDGLDTIYGHCAGYPEAGARDRRAIITYLKAHDIGADTFYVNRPGRTVGDIRKEQQLRDHIEQFLDERGEAGSEGPEDIRRAIAASLPDEMSWARTAAPVPFLVRNSTDATRVALVLLTPPALTILGLIKVAFRRSSTRRRSLLARVALGSVAGLLGRAVWQLRAEENRDDRRDRERDPDWQAVYAEWTRNEKVLGRREDCEAQNHMVSVTRVKPGWFRFLILRVVLWFLNLIARVTANKGTLGGITSIHFARWVLTPDRSLIFLSNYDGSWESYLNDFVDLAAIGLSAVWSNTTNDVGFPATSWLVRGGAKESARFKAYARSSMVPTSVWYSAYPDISAANIGNSMQVRDDLLTPLDLAATEAWLRRL